MLLTCSEFVKLVVLRALQHKAEIKEVGEVCSKSLPPRQFGLDDIRLIKAEST